MTMAKSFSAITLSLLVVATQSLSIFLGKNEPYCFLVPATKENDIRVDYMVSGLNEDQISFTVSRDSCCTHSYLNHTLTLSIG